MSVSTEFKQIIKNILDDKASKDPIFAAKYANKNIEDVCTYIVNQVKKSGCEGFADAEIYGMAYHFIDEELNPGEAVNCRIITNKHIELTEAEKKKAKQEAISSLIKEEKQKVLNSKVLKHKKKSISEQPLLF